MIESYDVVIVGSGEPGKYLAWTLGGEGKRVALVERRYVGGSCPNIACLPSKNVIRSAEIANYFRRAAEFGSALGKWGVEMRPRERNETGEQDLFRSRLDQIIDMKHPLVALGRTVDWSFLEERFGEVYTDDPGRPPLPNAIDGGAGDPQAHLRPVRRG